MSESKQSSASFSISVYVSGDQNSKALSVEVKSSETIESVKKKLQDAMISAKLSTQLKASEQILVLPNKPKDALKDTKTLADYGVTSSSTILHVHSKESLEAYLEIMDMDQKQSESTVLADKLAVSFEFSRIEDKSRFKTTGLTSVDDTTPKWLYIYPGLNMQAKCSNQECDAGKQNAKVYIRCGEGNFDVARNLFKNRNCPCCGKPCARQTMSPSFSSCFWRFEGAQLKDNEEEEPQELSCKWREAKQSKLQYFDSEMQNGNAANAKWSYLTIIVQLKKPSGAADEFEELESSSS
eukprot:TRINITY_DN8987_c0_g1_i1.p1 TRINITY_DN8987_c0_g1~~TRINITY_DN8987_c0_g1_i1.p1  ORF type:complete len:296 (-),score=60.81 TRINITY_DN8987_c0_g1_i1:369-1256(-)